MGDRSLLSTELRTQLQNQKIYHLAQVNLQSGCSTLPDRWRNSGELHLSGSLAFEWDHYSSALKAAGISLSPLPDTLQWAGGDGTGNITVKNLYNALLNQQFFEVDRTWFSLLWRWDIPLKLKLFFWLAGKEKPLTWDALRRRGWEGPGICPLCCSASEDIHHLLVYCSFTQTVWSLVLFHLSLPLSWSGTSFSHCFTRWLSLSSAPKTLPVFVCWQIWSARNRAIFYSCPPSSRAVLLKVLASFHWKQPSLKSPCAQSLRFQLIKDYTVAFFDGAALSSGNCCGAGGIFKTHPSRTTMWFLNCGEGTNNKAELLGLWDTLFLASCWSISHLHVLGDSRIIIDWISQKSKFQTVHNDSWKDKTRELLKSFTDVNFHHIPRSFNGEADALSKRALNEVVGRLSVFHKDSGIVSPISSINVFE
jgi:ribonuclease HI